MDFFGLQDQARRATRRLVLWYALAVLFVVASFNFAAAVCYGLYTIYWYGQLYVPIQLYAAVSATVVAVILAVTARRMRQLSEGGPAVAAMLGAHYVERGRATPPEARLLNVVEEMAIASGIAVPPVYVLDSEDAINALVAGHSQNEAVIVATRGAVNKLSRDELQGVVGHEFSHILNGDMALNLRLVGLLAGIACFGEWGEAMVRQGADIARRKSREDRGGEVVMAMFGAAIAFIGIPGLFAAEAIKAAISRQREFLADAASVQFTRNPEGIAGALDSILYLHAGTTLRAAHALALSHMFFAPAVVRWWAFPSHPPIEDRIRRAHPRFLREDYRRTRHASTYNDGRVAVLDGAGNVVEVIGGLAASVGAAQPAHVDYARHLLGRLPPDLKRRLATPDGAMQVMLALARAKRLEGVDRHQDLLLLDLALPALKELPQKRRDEFVAEFDRAVQEDGRLTLTEFVQATYLRMHLRAGAGKPIPTKFAKVEDLAQDAQTVISLIAHASRDDTETAHAAGKAVLGLDLLGPLPMAELNGARVAGALERLRFLQPFAKPRVLKACVATAQADGEFRLAEAELVRVVAATLDCPIPPVIRALDPATLAA
jgi:Zn-dependent protease with chaperone function